MSTPSGSSFTASFVPAEPVSSVVVCVSRSVSATLSEDLISFGFTPGPGTSDTSATRLSLLLSCRRGLVSAPVSTRSKISMQQPVSSTCENWRATTMASVLGELARVIMSMSSLISSALSLLCPIIAWTYFLPLCLSSRSLLAPTRMVPQMF